MVKVVRRSAKETPKRYRYLALTILDKRMLAKYTQVAQLFAILSHGENLRGNHRRRILCLAVFGVFYAKREHLRLVELEHFAPIPQKVYRIESFHRAHCYRKLRFKNKYLRKLLTGWGVYDLPEWIIIGKGGNIYHREMMFLLLIYRYAHGGTLYDLYRLGWGDEPLVCMKVYIYVYSIYIYTHAYM